MSSACLGSASICNPGSSRAVAQFNVSPPEIVANAWGTITLKVNNHLKAFKDVAILPTDEFLQEQVVQEWDWRWNAVDPMRHRPGIRECDLDRFFYKEDLPKPEVVILTRGRGHGANLDNPGPGELQVDEALIGYLKAKGVGEVYILKTSDDRIE